MRATLATDATTDNPSENRAVFKRKKYYEDYVLHYVLQVLYGEQKVNIIPRCAGIWSAKGQIEIACRFFHARVCMHAYVSLRSMQAYHGRFVKAWNKRYICVKRHFWVTFFKQPNSTLRTGRVRMLLALSTLEGVTLWFSFHSLRGVSQSVGWWQCESALLQLPLPHFETENVFFGYEISVTIDAWALKEFFFHVPLMWQWKHISGRKRKKAPFK